MNIIFSKANIISTNYSRDIHMLIVNGNVLESGSPETTLLNRAFKFGDGLFEEMRVYKGQILFLDAHLNHMIEGMYLLRFEFEPNTWKKEIQGAIMESIRLNSIQSNGRLRLHIYRSGTGAFAPLDHKPFYVLESYALKDNYFESPVHTSLVDYREIQLADGILSRYYASNSLPLTLAAIYARDAGFEEALLYGSEGVSMTSKGNLFIVKNKKLLTPPLESACVNGVMRAQIMAMCTRLKIPVQEKRLKGRDLSHADEVFVCNSMRGIVPVSRYNEFDMLPQSYVLVPFLRQCLLQYIEEILPK